ncbi:MAG: ATP-binding protein [Chloroflexota bacterium]
MDTPPFINRATELQRLQSHWASGRAELLVATGRRRVGKSRLLEHFFRDKPSVHIVGTLQKTAVQLADASRELYRAIGDPILQHQDFDSWDALLTYVGEYARSRRAGFIIDEFAYYCDESPELPSIVQRWWDRIGQRTQIMLVLAGSHVAFMENLVLGGQALYGRQTGELRLHPFDYADAGRFFPGYTPEDRLRAYGVFGGMPAYLVACDEAAALAENISRTVLRDDAYLRREPLYLLSQERSVDRPRAYLSVLRAIAQGHTQPSGIAMAAGFRSASDVAPLLERLREFRLVERIIPITAEEGGRISKYVLTDHFLAFWFRFVQPAEAALEQGALSWVLQQRILPELHRFVSRAQGPWEGACQDFLWRAFVAGQLGDIGFDRLGPWWEGRGASDSMEIDIVGLDGVHMALAASCKWRNEYAKIGDLDDLKRAAARIGATDRTHYVLFSRSGFDPSLVTRAQAEGVRLITPEDMFADAVLEASMAPNDT